MIDSTPGEMKIELDVKISERKEQKQKKRRRRVFPLCVVCCCCCFFLLVVAAVACAWGVMPGVTTHDDPQDWNPEDLGDISLDDIEDIGGDLEDVDVDDFETL